jgi:hypothetical protein
LDEIRKIKALIKFYFHLDADKMTPEELGKNWQELRWALKFTNPYKKKGE